MFEDLLSRRGLSLDRLKNFCAVADAGGISAAASGDPAKQSLYSRQIRELEEFFGAELTMRRGKRVLLTSAGETLAKLIREQFVGLDDFRRSCQSLPQTLTIAAGNSVIEWLLIPKMRDLRNSIAGENRFQLRNMRSAEIVSALLDMSVDLAVARADAVSGLRQLRTVKVASVGYALFLPRALSHGVTASNLKDRVAEIPLATSAGGQFRERLATDAIKANWRLSIHLSCSSFTQAARAVHAGGHGAVLPTIARSEFQNKDVREFPLPFLKDYSRPLCLASNRRLAQVRATVAASAPALARLLRQARD